MDEVFTPADLGLAMELIFDGHQRRDRLDVPLEQRVACAIAAARFGATRPVVVLQKKERSHG